MWVIRIFSGPQAGKAFPLKEGVNTIGRSPQCNITLASSSVSKEHARVQISSGKLTLTDNGSRNGTFVNGLKIQSQRIQPGDKFSLHDVIMDVAFMPPQQAHKNPGSPQMSPGGYDAMGSAAYNMNSAMGAPSAAPHMHIAGEPQPDGEEKVVVKKGLDGIFQIIQNYFDEVVMPGVYKIPQSLEFKWVLGVFASAFILFVTLMSAIPLMNILKDSIEQESMERALTIAKTIAELNQTDIAQGNSSTLSVQFAMGEVGVQKAYIIDALDRQVMAPANQAGQVISDIPFMYEAMQSQSPEAAKKVDGDTIVAVKSISNYNPETGSNQNKAYAVIVYNMGQLSVSNDKTISLLIQTLFIALIVGSILFTFMYKVIVHPIQDINRQLDVSLKDSTANITTDYDFDDLKKLVSNINSSLSRVQSGDSDMDGGMGAMNIAYDRSREMENLVQLIGFPAIAVKIDDQTVAAINSGFEDKTGFQSAELLYGPIDTIVDQSLKLNIEDLVSRAAETPDQMHTNKLEFSGENHDVTAQAIYGESKVAYVLITILPELEGGDF